MIDLKQKELAEWQKKNFGSHDDDVLKCVVGMSEEVGEVCHHILKGIQGIRGGVSGINKAEVADGVADVLIYGIQLLSRLDINAESEISKVIEQVLQRDWNKNPKGDQKQIQAVKCECISDHGSHYKNNLLCCNYCNLKLEGLA